MLRRRDPESHRDGHRRNRAHRTGLPGQLAPQFNPGAGHPRAGDVVYETLAGTGDFTHPSGVGGGRDEADEVQRGLHQLCFERRIGTQGKVRGQDPVRPRLHRLAHKSLHAARVQRVQIREDDHRHLAGPAQLREHPEHVVHRGPVVERALAGALNRGPVGHRVAEGDPEFDHVGPQFGESPQQVARMVQGGVSGGDVGDEARPPRRRQLREARPDSTMRHFRAAPIRPARRRGPRPCPPARSDRSPRGPRSRPAAPLPPPRPARGRSRARE